MPGHTGIAVVAAVDVPGHAGIGGAAAEDDVPGQSGIGGAAAEDDVPGQSGIGGAADDDDDVPGHAGIAGAADGGPVGMGAVHDGKGIFGCGIRLIQRSTRATRCVRPSNSALVTSRCILT